MFRLFNKTLSLRISLKVVPAIAILLLGSLLAMLYYSRSTVKQEALQKASQTLEGTVQRIDNLLLSVEQSTGNILINLFPHLDNPDMMPTYSRLIVETNPYINGCSIAFKEGFYKGRKHFMTSAHREDCEDNDYSNSPIVESVTNDDSYSEQPWFAETMASGKVGWTHHLTANDATEEPVVTFCVPLIGYDRKPVGVIGVDLSLSLLSHIVEAAKPSAHSYCVLLDKDGSYVVHPNEDKLIHQSDYGLADPHADPSVREAILAMISGETGYKPFKMHGQDYFVFYKPFKRIAVQRIPIVELGWSTGIIYPEEDIFGDYNSLSFYVLAIAVVGILVLFLFTRTIIHRQLKPLIMLTKSAQHIAKGNYSEPIPESSQNDEIGRLQNNFRKMQQSLAISIGELEQLKATLVERGEGLRKAYQQAQKAERMKISFLHNMTNQMLEPAESISKDVEKLCEHNELVGKQEIASVANDIQLNGKTITMLLENLLKLSDEDVTADSRQTDGEERKEVAHD